MTNICQGADSNNKNQEADQWACTRVTLCPDQQVAETSQSLTTKRTVAFVYQIKSHEQT